MKVIKILRNIFLIILLYMALGSIFYAISVCYIKHLISLL